jgi:Uma2 family endonuclease
VTNAPYLTLSPDWICELLSPSTERIDRAKKLRIYSNAGVRYAWLVHPLRQSLEIFARREDGWALVGVHYGTEKVRAVPFDAIELDLAVLWADISPPTTAVEEAAYYDY